MIKYYTFANKVRYALHQPLSNKLLKINAVVATICLVIFVGYWMPAKSKMDSIDEQIQNLRNEVRNNIKLAENVRLYQNTSNNVGLIEKRLNADTRQATIIDNLGRIAKRYRITIKEEAYDEGREKEYFQPLYHEITVEGGYAALSNFLHAINGLPTWTVIIESKISLHKDRPGIVVASLRLATYRKT